MRAVLGDVAARGGFVGAALKPGVFCPLGTGDSEIPGAIEALGDIGYEGWLVVEQDQSLTSRDTRESLIAGQLANREYLERLGV